MTNGYLDSFLEAAASLTVESLLARGSVYATPERSTRQPGNSPVPRYISRRSVSIDTVQQGASEVSWLGGMTPLGDASQFR